MQTAHQFYPTPDELADEMLAECVDLFAGDGTLRVLEPSAGTGSLLQAVRRLAKSTNTPRKTLAITAVEMDRHLSLASAPFADRMIHSDLVVMNPPFSHGAQHVLRAYEMLRPGGYLVALLNAETIMNAYTDTRRKLEELVGQNGSVEILAGAFTDAPRKTDVDTALVRIKKPAKKTEGFFDGVGKEGESQGFSSGGPASQELATPDMIGNLVEDYNRTIHALRGLVSAGEKYKRYRARATGRSMGESEYRQFGKIHDHASMEGLLAELTKEAWDNVLAKTEIKERLSTSAQADFEKRFQGQQTMPFTEENVYAMLEGMVQNFEAIKAQSVLDAFDYVVKYSPKNVDKKFAWKTNSAFRMGYRIIMPSPVEVDRFGYWCSAYRYHRREQMMDLDRALCFLTGKNITELSDRSNDRTAAGVIEYAVSKLGRSEYGMVDQKPESEFFRIKFYQKGSAHLTFKDRKLCDRLNQFVAKERGWLHTEEPDREPTKKQRTKNRTTSVSA